MSVQMKLKKINALNSELDKTKKALSKSVLNSFKKLMKENPLIEAIKWAQYTPHFNDGEECVFSVHDMHVKFDETVQPRQEDHYDNNFISLEYDVGDDFFKKKMDILNHEDMKALEKAVDEIGNLFASLQETNMKEEFGDGVQVMITKSGIEVEHYDHD